MVRVEWQINSLFVINGEAENQSTPNVGNMSKQMNRNIIPVKAIDNDCMVAEFTSTKIHNIWWLITECKQLHFNL